MLTYIYLREGAVYMRTFSNENRLETWKKIQQKNIDLLVIGGGITGAGIALDATTRGLRTVTVDMQDFAAGTSSRSTKLIHGGLRYLKQMQMNIVAEVGKERSIVYHNAPHITTPLWMMLPFYKGGTFGRVSTNLGLTVYDRLARVEKSERKQMLTKREAMEKEPLLQADGLKGAGYYVEYRTDDARLTIEVMKKAVQLGAEALNYAEVTTCLYDDSGEMIGVRIYDHILEEEYDVFARIIVNATGPWVDHVRSMDKSIKGKSLYITKGVHLIFDQDKFPLQQPIYFDVRDGRMVFAIPRDDKTYVGTTDTHYTDSYVHPTITEEDEQYLLTAVNEMFPTLSLTDKDIVSKYAGLRPLIAEKGKEADEISRKDELFISPSGLISIAGGKLTGYRKMAEKVVDTVTTRIQEEDDILYTESTTKNLRLSGGEFENIASFELFKTQMMKDAEERYIDEELMNRCVHTYGKNCTNILSVFDALDPEIYPPEEQRFVLAQLHYSYTYESMYSLVDFFKRRTGWLYFHIEDVKKYKNIAACYMGDLVGWTDEEKKKQLEQLHAHIKRATE